MPSFSPESWDIFRSCLEKWSGQALSGEEKFRHALEKYLSLLLERSQVVNLTAIDSWEEGQWKHLLDSLSLVHFPSLGKTLDWGTGGGLPGIPLSLWRREVLKVSDPVLFLDSVGKKIVSVKLFLQELGFDAERLAFAERGEAFLKKQRIDSVVMRAVAPPERALPWMGSQVKNWLIFCGPMNEERWLNEIPALERKQLFLAEKFSYELPNGIGNRSILHFSAKNRS